ncbi:MAG TPA: prolyl oligopeptidase family serine peptidase [Planctomycetia bacterium]|nr:prolyl oligopeptidase family serine peptidase [Planctomycetia bacterium]
MRFLAAIFFLGFAAASLADGPADNRPDNVRPIPPPGIAVPPAIKIELEIRLAELARRIAALKQTALRNPLARHLPDVEIFPRAVEAALKQGEFFEPKEFDAARQLLAEGALRLEQLEKGTAPWTGQSGLVVRGYVSKIDGSVQPYGLVIPPSYSGRNSRPFRLDVWLHGRGEKLSEVNFLDQRRRTPGEFAPPDAIVLHPYGRYCNAFKFAGEIDVLEALAEVKSQYRVDPDRVMMRGFSMGGAGCWQMAGHFPSLWAAATPGAGFCESAEFLRVFQSENAAPPAWERVLWQMYDVPVYAANFGNLPLIAYSGEKDRQKQAADKMAAALVGVGIELVHLIGPNTEHRYHPQAKLELERRLESIARVGRDPVPRRVTFTTPTLRYNRSFWVALDGLEAHWTPALVDARLTQSGASVETKNVSRFILEFGPGECPFDVREKPTIVIDRQPALAAKPGSDRSWKATYQKVDGRWRLSGGGPRAISVKEPGLQGPIDDAFMDSFLIVTPTGKSARPKVATFVQRELTHAIEHWRKHFRGEPRVKKDVDVTAADVALHHLIVFGEPESNAVLAKMTASLPLRWSKDSVGIGAKSFPADRHVPALIHPNPLNPKKYVVLNSGFTYREYDYLNNARQTPKLPDWAIVDAATPMTTRAPGTVLDAGFFDEKWEWQPRK